MMFLHAARIAKEQGYHSCLFLPHHDRLLYTPIIDTLALFAPCEEVGQVHCIPYGDLVGMNEERILATLQTVSPPTDADAPKKRRRSSKGE